MPSRAAAASVDPAAVPGWDNRALKRFLKDRGLGVKHYKERGLLVQDVLGVLETEAFDAQVRRYLLLAFYLVAALVVVRLARRYRAALHVALHVNPLWVAYWLLGRALAFMSLMNLASVLCSWVLPPRWNLAKVYFWDYLLPDFGSVPIPIPSGMGAGSGGGGGGGYPQQPQPQQAPRSMGINLMPLVVGWAIRRAQAEVLARKLAVPVFRQGFVPPPLPGALDTAEAEAEAEAAAARAAAEHAFADDDGGGDDDGAGDGKEYSDDDDGGDSDGGTGGFAAAVDDDVVFLRPGQRVRGAPRTDDDVELRRRRRQDAAARAVAATAAAGGRGGDDGIHMVD